MSYITGIVRQIDDLGRVVIPKELRNTFHMNVRDPVEIFARGGYIVLRKYQPTPLEDENADLRRRLEEINNEAISFEEDGPFNPDEAFDKVRRITKLSMLRE